MADPVCDELSVVRRREVERTHGILPVSEKGW